MLQVGPEARRVQFQFQFQWLEAGGNSLFHLSSVLACIFTIRMGILEGVDSILVSQIAAPTGVGLSEI